MPPVKKERKPRKPRAVTPHYTVGDGGIYPYTEENEPAYVVREFLEKQVGKQKAPTMAQIRRHIPFVMGQRMKVESASPFHPSDTYINGQRRLFDIQYPGKLEALVDRMVADGIIKRVDKGALE
jgi:hypothetical protein